MIPPKRQFSQRFLNRLNIRFAPAPDAQNYCDSQIAGTSENDQRKENNTQGEIVVKE